MAYITQKNNTESPNRATKKLWILAIGDTKSVKYRLLSMCLSRKLSWCKCQNRSKLHAPGKMPYVDCDSTVPQTRHRSPARHRYKNHKTAGLCRVSPYGSCHMLKPKRSGRCRMSLVHTHTCSECGWSQIYRHPDCSGARRYHRQSAFSQCSLSYDRRLELVSIASNKVCVLYHIPYSLDKRCKSHACINTCIYSFQSYILVAWMHYFCTYK